MLERASGLYGVPHVDATPQENPQTDWAAGQADRVMVDVAQLTHTGDKAKVRFATVAAAAPQTLAGVTHRSQWGDGAGQVPTVTKSATGRYSVLYAASFSDELAPPPNGLGETETLGFFSAMPHGWGTSATDNIHVQLMAISAHQIDVVVQSPAGTPADVGNVSGNPINVELWIQ